MPYRARAADEAAAHRTVPAPASISQLETPLAKGAVSAGFPSHGRVPPEGVCSGDAKEWA
jgi:hypothetical protein